jgi:hypothetical protein
MKQAALILFIHLLFLTFLTQISYCATYTIFMRDGGTIEASRYVIEGDSLKVFLITPKDAIVVFFRAYVDKIIKNEEEDSKKTSVILEKKLEMCDVVGCSANYHSCCKKVHDWTKRMESTCKEAEKRESYVSVCEQNRKKVSFWEAECQSCYIVSSCCGWNWD